MHREEEYRARCSARGLDGAAVEAAVAAVEELAAEAGDADGNLATAGLAAVEAHLAGKLARGEAGEARILALARYFLLLGAEAVTIRLLAYLSPIGVLPAMEGRLAEREGEAVRARVMRGIAPPAAGAAPESYPPATAAFVRALEAELGRARAAKLLRWNVHGVPAAAFAAEREHYLAAPSLEAWLAGWHGRQVAVLERHAADGGLWYEQRITPRVVEFVRGDQEILGGVREGDRILVAKIPYDPDRFLLSADPLERRRLACHCPLAASAIEAEGAAVPALWCNCSAGYEKFIFDVVFGEETEAEVLESVLAGDKRCRFAVAIPAAVLRAKAG